MRKFGLGVTGVIALTLAASGCAKKDGAAGSFDADRYFADLKSEKFVVRKAEAFDVDAVIAALPDGWTVSYASSDFDAGSGATVLTDLTFTAADNPDMGLRAEEISIWGGDGAALAARFSGAQLDGALTAASRIEASNIELFGLETLFQPMMDVSNAMVEGMVRMDPESSDVALSQSIEDYDFTMGKVIITELVLYPSVLDLKPFPGRENKTGGNKASAETDEVWHWFQKMGNFSAMTGFDDYATYDSVFNMTLNQNGQPSVMSGGIEFLGYKGYNRGDIDYALMKNMSYDMDMVLPVIDGPASAPAEPLKMGSLSERSTYKNIRLAKVMDHLARGVMPARTDTDFMSLGVWDYENLVAKFNSAEIYSIDSMRLDVSGFHWLVPEVMDIRVENMKYNVAGFADYMKASMKAVGGAEAADAEEFDEFSKIMTDVMPILKKYDLEEPSIDFSLGAKWDAETGASTFVYGAGLDNFTRYAMDVEGELPGFDAVMALIPEDPEDTDSEAVKALFLEAAKLESYRVNIKDEGGFEKGFAMAKDFAALAPEDSRETAFLRANTPEQLRQMMAGSLLLAAGPVHKAFPPATDYLQSASNFINEGGELTLLVVPPKPLGAEDMEAIAMLAQTDPDAVVEKLGISVEHKAPE